MRNNKKNKKVETEYRIIISILLHKLCTTTVSNLMRKLRRYFFVIKSLRYIYFYHGGDFLKLCGFSTRDGIINPLFFLFPVYFCFILCKISLVSWGKLWILFLFFIVFKSWLCRIWCISIQWLKSNYLRQSTNSLKMSQC